MIPTYCKKCKLQGHEEFRKDIAIEEVGESQDLGNQQGGKLANNQNRWKTGRGIRRWHPTNRRFIKNKDDEYVLNDNTEKTLEPKEGISTVNPFDALNDESQEEVKKSIENEGDKEKQLTTREWVQKTFKSVINKVETPKQNREGHSPKKTKQQQRIQSEELSRKQRQMGRLYLLQN